MTTARRTFLSLLAALPGLGFLIRRETPPPLASVLDNQYWSDRVAWRREQFRELVGEKFLDDLAKIYGIPPRILHGYTRVEWGNR